MQGDFAEMQGGGKRNPGRDGFDLDYVRRHALGYWPSSDFALSGSEGWPGIPGPFRWRANGAH